jgi:hypothetical protein
LFPKHEGQDLATFIQLALLAGWDFWVLPVPSFAAVFVSHDEFLIMDTDNEDHANGVKNALHGATLTGESESGGQ